MNGKLLLCLVVLVHTSSATSMFFHEPSLIVLKPEKENTDFGFSLGYRIEEKTLVVGSPHADLVGKVYGCHIDSESASQTCQDLKIDVKKLANNYDKNDKSQKFCLGATIAVTSKYFVTCAPLWTTTGVKEGKNKAHYDGSYGTCFVYSKTAKQYNGILEQSKTKDYREYYEYIYGGIGWSSLADEESETLLIAKSFDFGDIQYVNSTGLENDNQREFKSLRTSEIKDNLYNLIQLKSIGYAMAAGRYFSDFYKNTTVYAFSMKDNSDTWQIQFLYKEKNGILNIITTGEYNSALRISGDGLGDMFGAAMASADLDADGLTDLLVGAPTHTLPGHSETGALYIFKGGNMSTLRQRKYKIVSDENQSRFGSAIATADIDGDSLPEIFVSAPYEDSGDGALYIISGFQLQKYMKNYETDLLLKDITKLPGVQKIKSTRFRSFGFSLNIVHDINNNGCDELAVGAPQSGSVIIFRCLPTVKATIKATIEANHSNEVKSDTVFVVRVIRICVNITYMTKSAKISTKLQVVSRLLNGNRATLPNDKFEVDLSLKKKLYCEDVTVKMRVGEAGKCKFTATLDYLDTDVFNKKAFDNTWVRLSVDSEVEDNTNIPPACSEENCTPDLHMDILWDGSKEPTELVVNEKTEKNVTLVITNQGEIAYDSCVRVQITGGKERIGCEQLENQGEYKCSIPRTIAKHETYNQTFVVGIEKARNMNDTVHIIAKLYNDCESTLTEEKQINVKYIFGMRNVFISEASHNVTVTDTQIQNQTNRTLTDTHEYKIVNNGSLQWEDVTAIINVPYRPYFQSTHILINEVEKGCIQKNTSADSALDVMTFLCNEMKLYDVPILINVRNEIFFAKIMEHLVDEKLKIESNIEVRLSSSNDTFQFPNKTQITIIKYEKETSIGNNKSAIIILVIVAAVVILIIVALVLYKIGFFKRKEKSRLDSFKASIKSKDQLSEKPSTSGGEELKPESKEDSMEDFDIEVIDECAFEPILMTTDDDAALIVEGEEERTSHSSKKDVPSFKRSGTDNTALVDDDKDSQEKIKGKDRHSTKL